MSVTVMGLPPHLAELGRCVVMGIVNVTPDSFSDGGQFLDPVKAIAHGLAMARQGADIVDVGGESTRPGSARVSEQEELRRVLPVVKALTQAGVVVSIDTMRAAVAQAAVEKGASLVNDVSGGLADPQMPAALAQLRVPVVAMHWRGHGDVMHTQATYTDVVAEVVVELGQRLHELGNAGVDPQRVILDPGLGFAKEAEHNWQLLAGISALHTMGRPMLFGASRKRFLAPLVTAGPHDPTARDAATTALTAVLAGLGAWGVRVHQVADNADAVQVVQSLTHARFRLQEDQV